MTGILNLLAGAVSSVIKDTYFNLVTLLLPGNGTNGAQNNTFLDSSSNNFTITRNGNTTQGTFSPFSQTGWSNYFDGSNYLSISTASSTLDFGTGDFTIEMWVNPLTQTTSFPTIISCASAWSAGAFYIRYSNAGAANKFGIYWNGVGDPFFSSSSTYPENTWHHVAVTRSGSTVTLWVNGSSAGTGNSSASLNLALGSGVWIGNNASASCNYKGYISNIRVVKGTAVYTSNFTPPTSPLTAITNTSLLTCQSNRFIDNSSNAFAITVNGTPSVQAFSPFAPTAAYSAATNGGSGYFDGNGDYLSVGAAADWAFMSNSTAAWTIECWIYNDTSGTETNYFVTNSGSTVNTGIFVVKTTSETIRVGITRGVTASYVLDVTTTGTLVKNAWNHLFISYDQSLASSNCKIYINGASAGTGNKTANAPSSSNPATALYIGTYNGSAGFISGYVSSLRISNSIRSVPSSVPTSPYTSDANTKLLANFTNAGITDATAKNDLETVGNAQISTTQSKFGGSSIRFDGTGDWLSGTPVTKDLFAFGTGDFTVEFWAWKSANGAANYDGVICLTNNRSSGSPSWWVELSSSRGFLFYLFDGSNKFCQNNTTTGINDSTWHHWAICRSGSTWYLFKDGTALTKTTDTIGAASIAGGTFLDVGRSIDLGGTTEFNGYINDLRVTKGYARYTANFTPPSTALPLR